jgi:hypothetical protein
MALSNASTYRPTTAQIPNFSNGIVAGKLSKNPS